MWRFVRESNPRLPARQAGTLATELTKQGIHFGCAQARALTDSRPESMSRCMWIRALTTHIPCHRHQRYACDLECKDTPEVERTANHSLLVRDACLLVGKASRGKLLKSDTCEV